MRNIRLQLVGDRILVLICFAISLLGITIWPMKPDTSTAMVDVIRQIRKNIPFDLSEAYICSADCKGCSMKLLEFLDSEIETWERRLASGEKPSFADLDRLARMGKKVYNALDKNGLIKDTLLLDK